MINREKVIKGLSCCAKWMDKNDIDACNSCPYHSNYNDDDHGCIGELNNDAIALLKEQELVPVYEDKISKCACGNIVNRYWHPKFCGYCGKELMWY